MAAGLAAWHNSFSGVFVLDDQSDILGNPAVQKMWPPYLLFGWPPPVQRPLTMLTFAANHALGGFGVRGWHAVNLLVHVLAALALCTGLEAQAGKAKAPAPAPASAPAGLADPVSTFYLWLYEPDADPSCGWRMSNGHRANILSNECDQGAGYAYSNQSAFGHYWTLDLACP